MFSYNLNYKDSTLVTYSVRVHQHINSVEVQGERDLSVLELLKPVLEEKASEILVKRTRIGQEGS